MLTASQADRDILEHIVYDYNDTEMMEALRPSIEEAQPVQSQELALDYIGESAQGCVFLDYIGEFAQGCSPGIHQ